MKKIDWLILLMFGAAPVFFVKFHQNWKSRRETQEGYENRSKKGKEVC